MTKEKLNPEEKNAELLKYRALLLATLDYYLDNLLGVKTTDFDSEEHFNSLKIKTEEHFKKGRLTMLKNGFRDMTAMQLETRDLKFNTYLQNNTGYDIDIFKAYVDRINKIVERGKITTDKQFYDINEMVGQLCQAEPVDTEKINSLNKLLSNYESVKTSRSI